MDTSRRKPGYFNVKDFLKQDVIEFYFLKKHYKIVKKADYTKKFFDLQYNCTFCSLFNVDCEFFITDREVANKTMNEKFLEHIKLTEMEMNRALVYVIGSKKMRYKPLLNDSPFSDTKSRNENLFLKHDLNKISPFGHSCIYKSSDLQFKSSNSNNLNDAPNNGSKLKSFNSNVVNKANVNKPNLKRSPKTNLNDEKRNKRISNHITYLNSIKHAFNESIKSMRSEIDSNSKSNKNTGKSKNANSMVKKPSGEIVNSNFNGMTIKEFTINIVPLHQEIGLKKSNGKFMNSFLIHQLVNGESKKPKSVGSSNRSKCKTTSNGSFDYGRRNHSLDDSYDMQLDMDSDLSNQENHFESKNRLHDSDLICEAIEKAAIQNDVNRCDIKDEHMFEKNPSSSNSSAYIDEYHPLSSRTILIENLKLETSCNQLKEFFELFGQILNICVEICHETQSCSASIEFFKIYSAIGAIVLFNNSDLPFSTSYVQIEFARPIPTKTILIHNVDKTIDIEFLKGQCSIFGKFKYFDPDLNGNYLVEYDTVSKCESVRSFLKGAYIQSCKLLVDFASTKSINQFYKNLEFYVDSSTKIPKDILKEAPKSEISPSSTCSSSNYSKSNYSLDESHKLFNESLSVYLDCEEDLLNSSIYSISLENLYKPSDFEGIQDPFLLLDSLYQI